MKFNIYYKNFNGEHVLIPNMMPATCSKQAGTGACFPLCCKTLINQLETENTNLSSFGELCESEVFSLNNPTENLHSDYAAVVIIIHTTSLKY